MKKTVLITAIIFAFLLSAAGCGENSGEKTVENITRDTLESSEGTNTAENPESSKTDVTQTQEAPETAVVLSQVLSEIKTKVSVSGELDFDASSMETLYGLDPNDLSQAVGFVVMEGTFPHEVVMVEAKDSSAADRVEERLNKKHQGFVEQSKGYDAENYALACKCKVERNGNYISMFLSPDFETMTEIYNEYVK